MLACKYCDTMWYHPHSHRRLSSKDKVLKRLEVSQLLCLDEQTIPLLCNGLAQVAQVHHQPGNLKTWKTIWPSHCLLHNNTTLIMNIMHCHNYGFTFFRWGLPGLVNYPPKCGTALPKSLPITITMTMTHRWLQIMAVRWQNRTMSEEM